jgi:class I fructose-bisphosphate aldolase
VPGLDFTRRQLIVAMDHGRAMGPVPGLEDPARVIELAIEGGADAIMTSFGIVKRHFERIVGRIPVIMRVDGGPSLWREDWLANTDWRLLHTIDEAAALEVDGVCTMTFLGSEAELDTLEITAEVAADCRERGLPLMVEALPCPGPRIADPLATDVMAAACRIAFEHGADVLKTYATEGPFEPVVRGVPAPVLIAGGPKLDSERAALELVRRTLDAGAMGVVFGRNIWQSPSPPRMLDALRRLIHDDASLGQATAALG